MSKINKYFNYIKKLMEILKRMSEDKYISKDDVILLDTAEGSENKGDSIIMDYAVKQLSSINIKCDARIPTHVYDESLWNKIEEYDGRVKIVCGTNLLYGSMNHERNWKYSKPLSKMRNCCLLGVGWGVYENKINFYTRLFYKYILSSEYIHSVRDMYTYQKLKNIGIENVIYTGCVTMWNLSENFCKSIPQNKGKNVVTTITDYKPDLENDKFLLDTLVENYEKVYIWIQGGEDLEYLSLLGGIERFKILYSLEEYDACLEQEIDYVGTRLHAGIRALNHKRRSIIVAIDNRATEIAKETNLPIIKRSELRNNLRNYIYSSFKTDIKLPENNINLWKNQFKDGR